MDYYNQGHQNQPIASQAFSIPIQPGQHAAEEDEDEWEYEYSTTETDTYYLTVDLSIPDLTQIRSPLDPSKSSRNGKAQWTNPSVTRRRGGTKLASSARAGPRITKARLPAMPDEEDEGGQAGAANDVEQDPVTAQDKDADGGSDSDTTPAGLMKSIEEDINDVTETVQVLDLHTDNPLVSYKGHNFSCSWAENIGTELLFTPHDPTNPLPALRNLKDDVDLLAASSARLVSQEIKIEPKVKPPAKKSSPIFQGPMSTRELPIRIQMSKDTQSEKKQQAAFLEQLIAIKKAKGEEDEVTVVTTRRPAGGHWRSTIQKQKTEELEKLKASGLMDEDTQNKIERLESALNELNLFISEKGVDDKEDGPAEPQGPKKRQRRFFGERKHPPRKKANTGKGIGTPIRRGGGTGRARGRRRRESSESSGESTAVETPIESLSTPTPKSWDELEIGDDDAEEDEDDYQ